MESNSPQTSSIFSYNPLFSSTITLCILIFLYFPCNNSLKLIVSPILISTLVLLLSLLRLGTSQQTLQQQQQQQQQQQKSHANIVQPEPESEHKPKPEPELECENENKSEFDPKPKPEPRPQPHPESVNKNENENEPEPEPGLELDPNPNPEPEPEPEPELNKTSLTLGIQTSIELKPEPTSLKRDLSQEEEKVGTQCDRDEIQPIKHLGLEPESKQIIDTDIIIKEDKQRQPDPAIDPFPYSTETFVGWAVCAPLEVIYESYEGEEDLDMYAESGSDTDTDTGSSFTWEEEEKEGMFEIALDHGYGDYNNKNAVLDMKKLKNEFEVDEEDNLIEIDISF